MRAKRRINYKKGGHKYRTEKKIKGCNERDRKTDRTKKDQDKRFTTEKEAEQTKYRSGIP